MTERRDELLEQAESLQNLLISRATGGIESDAEYRRLREILAGASDLKEHVPRFVRTCRNLGQFWAFIKPRFEKYAERREFLLNEFRPLLEALEGGPPRAASRPASNPEAHDAETGADTIDGEPSIATGHLEFQKRLGEGAAGEVWLARDTLLGREVAVKFIKPAMQQVCDALGHAKALARVNHPSVATVHELAEVAHPETGEDADAVVMEYVDGRTLDDVLAGGLNDAAEIRRIGEALLGGLEAIHANGLTHLDFHEGNILVGLDGIVKIIDIQYIGSLALLSTQREGLRVQCDFMQLYRVLLRLLDAAQRGKGVIQDLWTRNVFDFVEIRSAFEGAFASDTEGAEGAPAAPGAIGVERSRYAEATLRRRLDQLDEIETVVVSRVRHDPKWEEPNRLYLGDLQAVLRERGEPESMQDPLIQNLAGLGLISPVAAIESGDPLGEYFFVTESGRAFVDYLRRDPGQPEEET